MSRNQATSCLFATILAAGALPLVVSGCESGEAIEAVPRTAAGAGRDVFGAGSSRTSQRAVSDGQETGAAVAAPSVQPVVAEKPDVAVSSEDSESLPSSPAPRLADPAVDASKYPGGIIPASANAQPLPGGPRLLVPHKTFRPEGKPPALRVSYDDLDLLKVLNIDPVPPNVVEQFPDWLFDLDGKRVRIRGFMYPAYEEMLSAFVLTRDTGVCCFGPNPKVYYLIGVKLKEGTTVRYVQNRPVDVVGTFHIQPVESDGQWFQLYKISDAAVVD